MYHKDILVDYFNILLYILNSYCIDYRKKMKYSIYNDLLVFDKYLIYKLIYDSFLRSSSDCYGDYNYPDLLKDLDEINFIDQFVGDYLDSLCKESKSIEMIYINKNYKNFLIPLSTNHLLNIFKAYVIVLNNIRECSIHFDNIIIDLGPSLDLKIDLNSLMDSLKKEIKSIYKDDLMIIRYITLIDENDIDNTYLNNYSKVYLLIHIIDSLVNILALIYFNNLFKTRLSVTEEKLTLSINGLTETINVKKIEEIKDRIIDRAEYAKVYYTKNLFTTFMNYFNNFIENNLSNIKLVFSKTRPNCKLLKLVKDRIKDLEIDISNKVKKVDSFAELKKSVDKELKTKIINEFLKCTEANNLDTKNKIRGLGNQLTDLITAFNYYLYKYARTMIGHTEYLFIRKPLTNIFNNNSISYDFSDLLFEAILKFQGIIPIGPLDKSFYTKIERVINAQNNENKELLREDIELKLDYFLICPQKEYFYIIEYKSIVNTQKFLEGLKLFLYRVYILDYYILGESLNEYYYVIGNLDQIVNKIDPNKIKQDLEDFLEDKYIYPYRDVFIKVSDLLLEEYYKISISTSKNVNVINKRYKY